jgi:hypothetical protein
MAGSRKRRIVKRVMFGLLIMVSLACSYVTAYMGAAWYEGARLGGRRIIRDLWVFEPLREYARSRAPGTLEFATAEMYCESGGEFSLTQANNIVKILRQQGAL